MNHLVKLASSQEIAIYNALCAHGPMTAAEIGDNLDIHPHAVYRASKQLILLNLVNKSKEYPVTFRAIPSPDVLNEFLLRMQNNFLATFPHKASQDSNQEAIGTGLTYIKNREELLYCTDTDISKAKNQVNFIVSGLVVPDSTFHIYRKKVLQGVKIRALLQDRNETSNEKLEDWASMGVEIKYTADSGTRIFIIDSRIVYLTSYDQEKKDVAFGIRFDYPALAVMMNDYFNQQWVSSTA